MTIQHIEIHKIFDETYRITFFVGSRNLKIEKLVKRPWYKNIFKANRLEYDYEYKEMYFNGIGLIKTAYDFYKKHNEISIK